MLWRQVRNFVMRTFFRCRRRRGLLFVAYDELLRGSTTAQQYFSRTLKEKNNNNKLCKTAEAAKFFLPANGWNIFSIRVRNNNTLEILSGEYRNLYSTLLMKSIPQF